MESPLAAQADLKVILVDLKVKSPADVPKCLGTGLDSKRVELSLEPDELLNTLEDYSMGEDPLEGPDCFMPELKVIFREYTYVFSIYCTSVKKYGNSAPFIPSTKQLRSDISMTESVVKVLDNLRRQYFGSTVDPKVAALFNQAKRIPDEKIDDSNLYLEVDDEKDLEKDALDQEGWFNKVKDPGLDEADSMDGERSGGQ
jgi:hypothetical protein